MEPERILEDQVRECFGRVVYTHKTHEKMADACTDTLHHFKIAQMWISALTSLGTVSLVLSDPYWVKVATALLALTGLMVSGYMKGFDPGGTAQKHRDAAATLWDIRESYLSLLTDLRSKRTNLDSTAKRRDELQALLAKVYKGVPQAISKSLLSVPIVDLTLPRRSPDNHWSEAKQQRLSKEFLAVMIRLADAGVSVMHLFLAAQNSVVFRLGRAYDKRNLPGVLVYQYQKGRDIEHQWAVEMPVGKTPRAAIHRNRP